MSGQDKNNPVIWLVHEWAEFYHLACQQIIANSSQAKPTKVSVKINKKQIKMLFAGWEVRSEKNCALGLCTDRGQWP